MRVHRSWLQAVIYGNQGCSPSSTGIPVIQPLAGLASNSICLLKIQPQFKYLDLASDLLYLVCMLDILQFQIAGYMYAHCSISLICLISLLVAPAYDLQPRKLQILSLSNGGKILSLMEDWIKLEISVPNLNQSIVCTDGKGYTFKAGTRKKFSNLWLPVEDVLQINVEQYNFWSANDVAHIFASNMSSIKVGYFETKISLSQFRQGGDLSFEWLGIDVTFTIDNYTVNADYYLLVRLSNQTISNETYSLDSSCYTTGGDSKSGEELMFLASILLIFMIY